MDQDGEPTGDAGPEVLAWSVGRLLARQGEPGAAERLADALMSPPMGARYLLRGHPTTKEHQHDGPRRDGRRKCVVQ